MCNPIHSLFGIEKVTKDFRGSNAAAKAWLLLHTSYYRRQSLSKPPRFLSSLADAPHCSIMGSVQS